MAPNLSGGKPPFPTLETPLLDLDTPDNVDTEVKHIHSGLEKAINRVSRRANDRLIFVERRIQYYRHAGQIIEV